MASPRDDMRAGWQLDASLELVALDGDRAFARWDGVAAVLEGIDPEALRSGAVLDDPDAVAALRAEGLLVPCAPTDGASSGAAAVTVLGNGALGRAVTAALADAEHPAITALAVDTVAGEVAGPAVCGRRFAARRLAHPPADLAAACVGPVVVVALEDVDLGTVAEVADAVLGSGRACLVLAAEADGVVLGPMLVRGASPCLRCSRASAYPAGELREAAGQAFGRLGAYRAEVLPRHRWLVAIAAAAAARVVRAPRRPDLLEAVWRIDLDGALTTRPIRRVADCAGCGQLDPAATAALGLGWGATFPPPSAPPPAPTLVDDTPWLRRAILALAERGAGRQAHVNGSLQEHLLATHAILRGWEQPEAICRAGLFHSVYGTDGFDGPLFGAWERDELRALLGADAEALVFAFGTIDRRRFRDDLDRLATTASGLVVHHWRTGEQARLDRRWLEALVLIELANRAEQARADDGSPGIWVARAARWGALLGGPRALRWLNEQAGALSLEEELQARAAYLRAGAVGAHEPGAVAELSCAIQRNGLVGEPRLVLAAHLLRRGDRRARTHALEGLRLLSSWGVAWDKRCAHAEWLRRGASLLAAADAIEEERT